MRSCRPNGATSHCMCLAHVKCPAVDSLKVLEDSVPLPLAHGLHAGFCRQAVLFTKLDKALQQQQLAGTARLCESSGSRRVDQ